ncbi:DUF190 domain-containing protein [Anabaena sp. CCY 9402-a]|uniref:DUF190 domain-containing protein n=1 Tax=Anabaena sp. CCY 9402-a TaxID=3103867 RepID=UPI0039C6A717
MLLYFTRLRNAIIDHEEAISNFISLVQEMVKDGLVTLKTVEITPHTPSLNIKKSANKTQFFTTFKV